MSNHPRPLSRSPNSPKSSPSFKPGSTNMSSKPSRRPSPLPPRHHLRRPVRRTILHLRRYPPMVPCQRRSNSQPRRNSRAPERSILTHDSSKWSSTSPSAPSPITSESPSPPPTSRMQHWRPTGPVR